VRGTHHSPVRPPGRAVTTQPGKDTQPVTSIPHPLRRRIVIGDDTHKYLHVAVALDQVGAVIGKNTISVDRAGYARLER